MIPPMPSLAFLKALFVDPPSTEAEKIITIAMPAMIKEYSMAVAPEVLLEKRDNSLDSFNGFEIVLLGLSRYEVFIIVM